MSYCDFVAGCVGGSAGIIVGHPLDTLKVCYFLLTPDCDIARPGFNGFNYSGLKPSHS